MTVLLDCDGVLSNFTVPVIQHINKMLGTSFQEDEVVDWDICATLGVDNSLLYNLVAQEGFCVNLPIRAGSVDFVEWLRSKHGEPYVVTSPWWSSRHWMHERQEWLHEHFGIKAKNVIQTNAKMLIDGNVLVEDKLSTVCAWSAGSPKRLGILIDHPWNRQHDVTYRVVRTHNWDEVKGALGAALSLLKTS